MMGPPVAQAVAPKSSRTLPISIGVAAVVVIAAAALFLSRGGATIPKTIQGAPLLQSEQANKITSGLESIVEGAGGKAKVAIYGGVDLPAAMLVVFQEATDVTFDEEWSSFSGGFSQSASMGQEQDQTVQGKTLRCAQSGDGSLCLWGSGDRYSAVVYRTATLDAALGFAAADLPPTADISL